MKIYSKNDDYTAYGNLTADGEIEVEKVYMAPNGRRYVAVEGETGTSFHRLGMQISGVNLRPSVAGVYFNSIWQCDDILASKITAYGVAVSTVNMPGVNFASDSDTLYTVLDGESFQSGQAQTSAIIENILTAGADNAVRGTTPIYATSYVVIDGQLTVTGEDKDPVAGGVSYTLARLMEENPEKKKEYLELFVDLQLEVQRHTCPMLGKLKDKMNRKISEAELDATTRYELHTRLEGMKKHTKVCHGDFNPSNIIISDEDGKAYIIDWAHATQGNASADVARTYLLFWLAGDTEGAKKYMELFCKMSDTARQYIERWLPIVAASQSVKGKPEERQLLLSWANVVDYE